MEGLIDRWMDG